MCAYIAAPPRPDESHAYVGGPVSIKVMAEVWTLELRHEQQSVLLALADHAHDDGTHCFPSIDYLAWKTAYDRRTVQRTMRALEASGLIKSVGSTGGGRGHATEYVILTRKGVRKSPFLTEERAASRTQRAAHTTKRAVPTPPQPSVTIKNRPAVAERPGRGIVRAGSPESAAYLESLRGRAS